MLLDAMTTSILRAYYIPEHIPEVQIAKKVDPEDTHPPVIIYAGVGRDEPPLGTLEPDVTKWRSVLCRLEI